MTIQAIERQDVPNWEIVLVPQGGDPALAAVCKAASRRSNVRVIHLSAKGLSRARNAAAAEASGDVLAFTDDDCEPAPNWVQVVGQAFADDPDVGLVAGAVIAPPAARGLLATCPAMHPLESVYDPAAGGGGVPDGWDWMGANFALRRSIYERIGVFDDHLGAGGTFSAAEDTDYKLRLEAAGVRMRCTPQSVVHHTYGTRTGLRARISFSRGYARGMGGLAGKLTLAGDPRGEEWAARTRELCVGEIKRGRVDRFLPALHRYREFSAAYRECLSEFRFDCSRSVLVPRGRP
jgi:GT2 family glycosyltransferase